MPAHVETPGSLVDCFKQALPAQTLFHDLRDEAAAITLSNEFVYIFDKSVRKYNVCAHDVTFFVP